MIFAFAVGSHDNSGVCFQESEKRGREAGKPHEIQKELFLLFAYI